MHLHGHEFQVVEIDGKPLPGRCATPCWCRPAAGSWWPSTPTIRGFPGAPLPPALPSRKPGCSRRCAMSDPFAPVLSLISLTLNLASAPPTPPAPILKQTNVLSFEGTLNYYAFLPAHRTTGCPQRRHAEPTYILATDRAICTCGDEICRSGRPPKFDQVQVFRTFLAQQAAPALSRDLRRLVGKRKLSWKRLPPLAPIPRHHHAPANAALNQNYGCFRPHAIFRHCHDHSASVTPR